MTGRHPKLQSQPLNNPYLSILDRLGVNIERPGDSTARLAKLDGSFNPPSYVDGASA
jgi:hypothetical protein